LHDFELALQGSCSLPRFKPSVTSENGETESEKRNEIMRNIVWVSNGGSNTMAERVNAIPGIIMVTAAICGVVGLGLLATGAHLIGDMRQL
jgi:hypothetical protein